MNIQQRHLEQSAKNRPGTFRPGTVRGVEQVGWWGVCLHWFGNSNMNEWGHYKYFYHNTDNRAACYNYLVGDDIIELIPKQEISIHTNSSWYNNHMVSIGCAHEKDGSFSKATLKNLKELTAYLLFLCNGTEQNIRRHYDAVDQNGKAKHCPLWFVEHPNEYNKFRRDVKHGLMHLNQLEE